MTFEEFCVKAISLPVPFKTRGRDWSGWDWWGLIVVAYREVYGIEIATYTERYRSIKQKDLIASVYNEGKKDGWYEVDEAQEGDVVIVYMDGRDMHSGLAIDKNEMIHAENNINTVVEKISNYRLEGIYRRNGK